MRSVRAPTSRSATTSSSNTRTSSSEKRANARSFSLKGFLALKLRTSLGLTNDNNEGCRRRKSARSSFAEGIEQEEGSGGMGSLLRLENQASKLLWIVSPPALFPAKEIQPGPWVFSSLLRERLGRR